MIQKEHTLSWAALGRVVLLALGLYLAWRALDVLVALIMALIIATALFPFVRRLRRHMSLLWAAVIVFSTMLVPFILFGVFIVPRIIGEIPSLLATLHEVLSNASFLPEQLRAFDALAYFTSHSGDFLSSTKTVALGVVSVITVFFMAFYFVLDNERFLGFFLDLFPNTEHKRVRDTLMEVARLNGLYIRGNVLISIICSAYLFIVLAILHVPFALPLAIFAGLMDLLPLVGSTLGTIPALIIGFTVSPLTGILILILHLVYQQLENVIISPAIYNKALDISPALSFLSVVIGAGLFGILGAFLALPVAASLPAMVRYYQHYQQTVNTK
jgi:predicted PurR-regulated permease PerM